jgi:hypothetical protein
VTFVVRAARDDTGGVRGSITRVRTGEVAPFVGITEAGRVLADMLGRDPGGVRSRQVKWDAWSLDVEP